MFTKCAPQTTAEKNYLRHTLESFPSIRPELLSSTLTNVGKKWGALVCKLKCAYFRCAYFLTVSRIWCGVCNISLKSIIANIENFHIAYVPLRNDVSNKVKLYFLRCEFLSTVLHLKVKSQSSYVTDITGMA